jgi:hypothetical protein
MIPRDSPSCYDSAMRNLVVLFIDFIARMVKDLKRIEKAWFPVS